MSERPRIVHLSTTHRPFDVRIFEKECRTLADAGYEVHFIVPDAQPSTQEGVQLHALDRPLGGFRPFRIVRRLANAYRIARRLDADLYHFHDCELIPVGCLLRRRGAKVVYDVHEHFPLEAFSVHKRRRPRAVAFYLTWSAFEWVARRLLDGFIPATPYIARRFPRLRTALVRNLPRLADYPLLSDPTAARLPHMIYVGGITSIRGLREAVAALGLLPEASPIRLRLLGEFTEPGLAAELRSMPGWARVDYLGYQPRAAVVRHLGECCAGLVVFHPERDHVDAQPNKMFEYMAAGLPIIASDFPLWRQIAADTGCGIVVNPLDPAAIARAMSRMAEQGAEARAMGERGRAAVRDTLNWERESSGLLKFYARLLGAPSPVLGAAAAE